ncbi:histidine phosphatase family protein [Chitinispirillales bacterium ANBcel5]|uniref:histidine phosphatase family protein n=1 Tax=Cellulosispirillum alkaliphilum TaxID=3039283 RepID=UPI002A5367CE|nr:histidine phosphatase family protein [Chitinispirillales bacterium ANBcel5]
MVELFLVRHGYVDFSGKIPGRLKNVHLSERGYEQSKQLVKILGKKKIDVVYSSPLERCVETAKPLCAEYGIPLQLDSLLIELDYGNWNGKTFESLEHDYEWKRFHSFRSLTKAPNGESMISVQNRMITFIEKLKRETPHRRILIVSHNEPIKSVISYLCGIALDMFLRLSIDPGSISEIRLFQDSAVLKTLNFVV